MIQEKDSAPASGDDNTPAADGAQAKKPRATARKTASKPSTAKKKTTETAEAASPAKTASAPRKPRATAKTAAKAKAPSRTTKSKTAPTAEPSAAPDQAASSAADAAETAAAPRRTAKAAKKPAAAQKTAAAKTGPDRETPSPKITPEALPETAPDAAPRAVTAKAPQEKRKAAPQTARETLPAAEEETAANAAPEKKARPSRTRRSGAAAKRAAKEKAASVSLEETPAPSTGDREPTRPETADDTAREAVVAVEATADSEDAPLSDAADEGRAKSSTRRSRRGGRRRNKSRAAAADADAAQPAALESDGEPEAESAPEPEAVKSPQTGRGRQPQRGKRQQEEEAEPAKAAGTKASGKRKMFISVLSGELVEVVLAEDGIVVEYYVEMQHQAKVKGNIYKAVVSNIDANLQAAFISYAGGVKNGFLQIDEVHPEYYLSHQEPAKNRKYPPIQKVLKPGQEILVQVVKEPAGTKGAFLTSYLSLPGRFLVLTPGREQIGVSRKVDSDDERSRLRAMLEGLTPGKGLGVIVRTVSEGASKTSLQRDLQFLKRLWKDVRTKGQSAAAPSLIYEELDLATRAVRDYLTDDVAEVWVDDAETAKQVTELAALLFPKKQNLVQVHGGDRGNTLFERFAVQKQLDQIHSREVALPSGGRLVFDSTEALTAIDINSGRSSGKSNFEDMAFRTNLDAANAIPLQLRLRDIGGQVVVDFIEMRDRNHWRDVEKAVRSGMKGDRARYDVGKIGPFGMLEIVRQRLGSSAISVSLEPCPCCKGTGMRRNMEWQSMQALREINKLLRQAAANKHAALTYRAEPELAVYLLNAKRVMLHDMEEQAGVALTILPGIE